MNRAMLTAFLDAAADLDVAITIDFPAYYIHGEPLDEVLTAWVEERRSAANNLRVIAILTDNRVALRVAGRSGDVLTVTRPVVCWRAA